MPTATPAKAYTTQAICLRTWNTSDTSKVGVWLSPTHGAIRAMAKGIRKGGKGSALAGACYPFMVNNVQFLAKANLHLVTQCRGAEGFDHLQHELMANALATCLLAAAEALAGPNANQEAEGTDSAELYEPLYTGLQQLNHVARTHSSPAAVPLQQSLLPALISLGGLCQASGHAPQWHQCIHSQQAIPTNLDPIPFDMHDGGVHLVPLTEAPTRGLLVNLTRPTWQALQTPTVDTISNHPNPAKLLSFYQHFIAHIAEKRQPLTAFTFALQLLDEAT